MDLTHGINPHQSAKAMAEDYKRQVAAADAAAEAEAAPIPKEEMDVNLEAERFVSRGRLNPETGAEIPLSDKSRKVWSWVPSQAFLDGYDQIRWD